MASVSTPSKAIEVTACKGAIAVLVMIVVVAQPEEAARLQRLICRLQFLPRRSKRTKRNLFEAYSSAEHIEQRERDMIVLRTSHSHSGKWSAAYPGIATCGCDRDCQGAVE